MVNYKAFCDSIDSAFTIPGIEKNPTLKVQPVASAQPIKKILEFDEAEKIGMKAILEAYKNQIITKRLNLKPMFQDFDITNCGYVTKTQFVRVLNQLGIMVDQ